MTERLLYRSAERCWRCAGALIEVRPPFDEGWRFYCDGCKHLTLTKDEADDAWRGLNGRAIGAVVAVHVDLAIDWRRSER